MLLQQNRHFGLDIMRAVAIIAVLISHGRAFLPSDKYNIYYTLGGQGVELFFILSGFLIGGILIRTEAKSGINIKSIMVFWPRRWYRTIPLYWFAILVCFFALPIPGQTLGYFLFLQGFHQGGVLSFLPVSWSLVIEEFFYLSLPIVALAISPFKRKHVILTACLVLLASTEIVRYLFNAGQIPRFGHGGDWRGFPFRFTPLLAGALIAWFDTHYRPAMEKFVISHKYTILALLLASLGLLVGNTFFFRIAISHEAIQISFASLLLLFLLYTKKTAKSAWAHRFVVATSVLSYSLYLFHWIILCLLRKYIENERTLLVWATYIILSYAVSWVTYRFVEVPYLRYRDNNFKD